MENPNHERGAISKVGLATDFAAPLVAALIAAFVAAGL